jgi:hypothetical protein
LRLQLGWRRDLHRWCLSFRRGRSVRLGWRGGSRRRCLSLSRGLGLRLSRCWGLCHRRRWSWRSLFGRGGGIFNNYSCWSCRWLSGRLTRNDDGGLATRTPWSHRLVAELGQCNNYTLIVRVRYRRPSIHCWWNVSRIVNKCERLEGSEDFLWIDTPERCPPIARMRICRSMRRRSKCRTSCFLSRL